MDYLQRTLADLAVDYIYGPEGLEDHEFPTNPGSKDGLNTNSSGSLETPAVKNDASDESGKEQLRRQLLDPTTDQVNDQKRFPCEKQPLPALSEGGVRIIVMEDETGRPVPAMILTSQIIREWNIILKSRRRVAEFSSKMYRLRKKIDEKEAQKRELKQRRVQLKEAHEDLTDEEFAELESVTQLRASFEELAVLANEFLQQFNMYKEKLEQAEDAPKEIRSWMERYWGYAMAENNLLEPDEASDDELLEKQEEHDRFPVESREPTPSETAREELYTQLREGRERIAELEEIVENWQQHYDEELVEYLAAVEDGTCENSRTIFDLCLLEESQEKIGALVGAEKEYDRVLMEARHLGIGIDDGNTESDVVSNVDDDGYTLSFELEMSSSVDKRWIVAWAEEIENEDPDQQTECSDVNEWEVKSLAQNERDSVVYDMMARGKRRKKIDKWRSVCEAVKHPGILIPDRAATLIQSVVSSDILPAEHSPFFSIPISSSHGLWQPRRVREDPSSLSLQNPQSPDFSSTQSSPFIMSPITPSLFRSYEIRIQETERSPEEALSPFSISMQQQEQSQDDYGPFSPVDIQDDLI